VVLMMGGQRMTSEAWRINDDFSIHQPPKPGSSRTSATQGTVEGPSARQMPQT